MEMILCYFSLSLLSCWLLELGCGRFLFSGCNLWADVCRGVNLPVHIFKCQLWLLSQGWRAKHCPFSSSDCRRLQSDKNLTHSAVGPRWRSGLRSLPSVSPPAPVSVSTSSVSASVRARLPLCPAPEPSRRRFMSCACLLIRNLCHMSPAFPPDMFAVESGSWRYKVVSREGV